LLIFSSITKASNDHLDICLAEKAKSENQDMTLGELNRICNKVVADDEKNQPAVEKRFNSEKRLAYDPFVITPHKMNYLLPVTYTDNINQLDYSNTGSWSQDLDDMEAKLQISFKVLLLTNNLFNKGEATWYYAISAGALILNWPDDDIYIFNLLPRL